MDNSSGVGCAFAGCVEAHKALGFCRAHYRQYLKGRKLSIVQSRRKKQVVLSRDELGRKECTSCGVWYPESLFHRDAPSVDGLHAYCKTCRADKDMMRKYGISIAQRDDLFNDQGRSCALCLRSDPGVRGWHVDHDHSTGVVRGVLCTSCNLGLGQFNDDVPTLQRAIEYLRQNSDRSAMFRKLGQDALKQHPEAGALKQPGEAYGD